MVGKYKKEKEERARKIRRSNGPYRLSVRLLESSSQRDTRLFSFGITSMIRTMNYRVMLIADWLTQPFSFSAFVIGYVVPIYPCS